MILRRLFLHTLLIVVLQGCSVFPKDDTQALKEYAACDLFKKISVSMPSEPLYTLRTGQCSASTDLDNEQNDGTAFYTDPACQQEVDYKPTSFFNYCKSNLLEPVNHHYIGNAAEWANDGGVQFATLGKNSKWTLSHGPSLDVLALSPKGNHRPFMKQVEYRDIGGCHLEMRVYKKNIPEKNLKPLILIHGGAWKYRGFGAIGGEVLVSQFTERGFIVFEPYYRLMGNADGPVECRITEPVNNISPGEMIVADIENSLGWVKRNGELLGAQQGAQVTLVGQSAGAHLASWLASHDGADVSKVLVLYTPADIKYYVQELGIKYPWEQEGRELIQQFLGVQDLHTIQSHIPPFVEQNSFPDLIRAGVDFPPIFMIHGNADTLVPVDMSSRMCDALAAHDPAKPMTTAGGTYKCGTRRGVDNILHVVDGANHMLDLRCIVDPEIAAVLGDNFKELGKLCPSGSPEVSKEVVRPAMLEGVNWLL